MPQWTQARSRSSSGRCEQVASTTAPISAKAASNSFTGIFVAFSSMTTASAPCPMARRTRACSLRKPTHRPFSAYHFALASCTCARLAAASTTHTNGCSLAAPIPATKASSSPPAKTGWAGFGDSKPGLGWLVGLPDDVQELQGVAEPPPRPVAGRLAATAIAPPAAELARAFKALADPHRCASDFPRALLNVGLTGFSAQRYPGAESILIDEGYRAWRQRRLRDHE